jgi:hypothetical protein
MRLARRPPVEWVVRKGGGVPNGPGARPTLLQT